MNLICKLTVLLLLCFGIDANALQSPDAGDSAIVIVTSAQNKVESLSKKQVIDIYMGRAVQLPNEERAVALELNSSDDTRALFYQSLVDMDLRRVNAYWSRLLFSGRAQPPQRFENFETFIQTLASNPNAVAYMEKSLVPEGFKTVYEFSISGEN